MKFLIFTLVIIFSINSFSSKENIFSEKEKIHGELSFDIKSFIQDRKKYYHKNTIRKSLDGELRLNYKGEESVLKVKIMSRGNNRLKSCGYPPIKLKIISGTNKNIFRNNNEIKVVSSCHSHTSTSQALWESQKVHREYLAYQFYPKSLPST